VSGNRPQLRAPRLLNVGRFFGVPIYFAPSWLIIAALLTFYYAPLIDEVVTGISTSTAYLLGFAFAVLFALCVLAHELGHTAVSLMLHSPVRRVVIFLLGGVSEIERDPVRPRDEFLIAAAGPLVSLLLSAAAFGGYQLLASDSALGVLVVLLFWSNLVVALFNLLPGLPLDGGRLLRAGVWAMARNRLVGTRISAWTGRFVAVGIAVGGLVLDNRNWGLTAGLFGVALGAYMWFGAGQSLRAAELIERVPRVGLERLLRPGLLVPSDVSVAEALRRAWTGSARGLVVVDATDAPRAIVDEARIGAVPPDRRPWTLIDTVARPLEPGLVLDRGLSGEDLLAAVRATPAHEYLVVNTDGSPAGILATADLASALKSPA
jgi:Zn-dependent protease